MKKKNIIIASTAAAILIPFIAMNATIISTGADNRNQSNNSGGEDLNLTVQIHTNGAPKVEQVWTTIISNFMDETNIDVKTYTGVNVNTQLKAQWDANTPPDFLFVDGSGLSDAAMVKDGKFLALDEWFEDAMVYGGEDKLSVIVDKNLIAQFADGKMYTLPIMSHAGGVFYDKNFMTASNFSIPSNYEETMEEGKKMLEQGVAPLTYPGQYASYLLWSYLMPAYAAYEDNDFFNAICSAKDPEIYRDKRFKAVLERFKTMVDANYLLNDTVNYSHSQSQAAWFNHKAAAIANGMWLEGEIASSLQSNPDFLMYYTLSPLHLASQPSTAVMDGNTIAIARYGKHQENALKFAAYLLREDNQARLTEAYGYLSSLRGFDYSECDLTSCARQSFETIRSAKNLVYHRYDWGTVGDIFNTVINGIVDGSLSIDAGIERIINEAKKQ